MPSKGPYRSRWSTWGFLKIRALRGPRHVLIMKGILGILSGECIEIPVSEERSLCCRQGLRIEGLGLRVIWFRVQGSDRPYPLWLVSTFHTENRRGNTNYATGVPRQTSDPLGV